jgi:hypothetical protein
MNVYRMNDYDWVAATTAIEASEFYRKAIMPEYGEEEEDLPEKLTESELMNLVFHHDDGHETSFMERLEEELANRGEDRSPFFFASTEY